MTSQIFSIVLQKASIQNTNGRIPLAHIPIAHIHRPEGTRLTTF